jgi:hypothetical protein
MPSPMRKIIFFTLGDLIVSVLLDCLLVQLVKNGIMDKKNSVFWQYSQNQILDGYSGPEKLIDMNVFMGTEEEFENYPNK